MQRKHCGETAASLTVMEQVKQTHIHDLLSEIVGFLCEDWNSKEQIRLLRVQFPYQQHDFRLKLQWSSFRRLWLWFSAIWKKGIEYNYSVTCSISIKQVTCMRLSSFAISVQDIQQICPEPYPASNRKSATLNLKYNAGSISPIFRSFLCELDLHHEKVFFLLILSSSPYSPHEVILRPTSGDTV